VEWVKNQFALAKTGDTKARRKLLTFGCAVAVVLALLISGQVESSPIPIAKKTKTQIVSQSGFVHITGEVKRPGVYQISPGMRLFEAIGLAGGFTKSAIQDSVNLARVINDGEQIVVSGGESASNTDNLIHLNRATASELDSLPGIGPTLANRIVDYREANGSFGKVGDLQKVAGIGDKLFSGIKELVAL
jgi:competence protein ComEA